jgi:hypothetical protein
MFITAVLAGLVALIQALTAWLGFYVSTRPQLLENKLKVLWYRIFFVALSAIGIVLVVIITHRASQVERVHFAITKMKQTYTPWPVVGEPLAFNIYYKNVGNGMAFDVVFEARAVLKPDYSSFSEQEAIAEFQKWLQERPLKTGLSIPKDLEQWNTASGGILSPEDLNNLLKGRRVMYLVGIIQFRDDFGKHTQQICQFLQPPEVTGSGGYSVLGIFAQCDRHNGEVAGWEKPIK